MPVSVRPRLTSSSRRLSSFACQRPPSSAAVVTAGSPPLPVSVRPHLPLPLPPALVPCPPASAHACRRRCTADAPSRSLPSAAALAVLPPPLPSLQPPSSSAATITVATNYGTTFRETGFYSKMFSESRFRLLLTKTKKELWQAPSLQNLVSKFVSIVRNAVVR